MNIFQFIIIIVYALSLIAYLYMFTNRFQKGWLTHLVKGIPFPRQKGFVDFRIFSVMTMVIMVITLKTLQGQA